MNRRPARNIALSNAFCHKTVSKRQQADMLPEPQHMQQKIYLPSHMQGAGACGAAAGAELNNGLQTRQPKQRHVSACAGRCA